MMVALSVLIPSRSEMFLARTVQDILDHSEAETEVIAVVDGAFAGPPIPEDKRVRVIWHYESIGQRAATNEAALLSKAKWLMKCDAHCAFQQGFDVQLLKDAEDDWTIVPAMLNLHAFNWVCPEGHTRYQGPSGPCTTCGAPTEMDIVWISKPSPRSRAYCFDSEPHFRYMRDFNHRREGKGDLTESMSLQGSCFMLTREKYWELDICDESYGSWGSQGIQVACKTWLSGGRVIVDNKTSYAHMFRTQGGDFGFPYEISGRQVERAKKMAREEFFGNAWPRQIRPLSWLIERFWPVPGWSEEELAKVKEAGVLFGNKMSQPVIPVVSPVPAIALEPGGAVELSTTKPGGVTIFTPKPMASIAPSSSRPTKGIVYYTDNRVDVRVGMAVRNAISRNSGDCELVSATLQPLAFGKNVCLPLERSIETMFKQILAGLEAATADIIFFCEHDVLYAPGYFDFTPSNSAIVMYNLNIWQVRATDGHCLYYEAKRTSQLCAYRDVLLKHYRRRVELVAEKGFSRGMGFEPGTHRRSERVDDLQSDSWVAKYPNLDIKHGKNLTPARWRQDQFRDQRNCRGWQEADEVPYWGIAGGRFTEILNSQLSAGELREVQVLSP